MHTMHHRTERASMRTRMAPGMDLEKDMNSFAPTVQNMSASQRVHWAMQTFPGHIAMSTSFGIHSSCLLHLATQVCPDVPIIWIDTGYLPAETYRYAEELHDRLDLNLFVSTSAITPARMEATYGKLWEDKSEESHKLYGLMRKNEPLKRSLKDLAVKCLIVGLRSDQSKHRADLQPLGIQYDALKLLPILEWSKKEVENYMDDNNLPRHPLEAEGYVSVGDYHSSRPLTASDSSDRSTRFSGVSEECGLHTDDIKVAVSSPPPVLKSPTSDLGGKLLDAYNLSGSNSHPTIVMVKKRMKDGNDCRRCKQVQKLIERDNFNHVDETVFAVEGEEKSVGVQLSKSFGMRTAPFFVVRMPGSDDFTAVESYLKLKKMVKDLDAVEEKETETNDECAIDFTYEGVHYTEGDCKPKTTLSV